MSATRTITDIVVPGAVVPFTYTRIWNSNGARNGWRHNWAWEIDEHSTTELGPGGETNDLFFGYIVNYPDGRVVEFSKPQQPQGQPSLPAGAPGTYMPNLGVQDRFVIQPDGAEGHLLLSDGTVVNFNMHDLYAGATSIVDPYGLTVFIASDGLGTMTVTEPGGRQIFIRPGSVTTSLGQSVTYTSQSSGSHIYNWYYDDPDSDNIQTTRETVTYNDVIDPATGQPIEAHYVYKTVQRNSFIPNTPPPDPHARLIWASDPMFEGPLQQVKYVYVDNPTAPTGDAYLSAVLEVRWTPDYHDPGVLVSRVEMLPWTYSTSTGKYSEGYWTRKETRGDGAVRTISYLNSSTGNGQALVDHLTDFKNDPTKLERYEYQLGNVTQNQKQFQTPTKITDARGKITDQTLEPVLGRVRRQTHHEDTSYRSWEYTDPANPYYVATTTDELWHTTTYTREMVDPYNLHRVRRIDYPDLGFEEFTYSPLGQILTHTMTSGGTETFTYDGRGLKQTYCPPPSDSDPNPCDHPTRYFYYTSGPSMDRLQRVQDPRGNSTSYEYNGRGQVTKVTHQDGTYTQSSYNGDGTVAWTADENHPGAATDPNQRTRFTYDEYRRVLTVTNPKGETTTTGYALDWQHPLAHTTNNPKYVTTPGGRTTIFDYDANFRKIDQVVGLGTPDEAWTLFEYDDVGNLTKTTDPLFHDTLFGYDDRNRQTTITDALGHVTKTDYDVVGNKNWIKHAVGTAQETIVQFPEYDAMNRLKRQIDERNVTTKMSYDLAGNLLWSEDGNINRYCYSYDALNRRTHMTYPTDSTGVQRTEKYGYDSAGNLTSYTNRAGNLQSLCYDNRNRQWWFQWDDGYTSQQQTVYDPASRVTQIWNWDATLNYTYWENNLLKTEQELTGSNYNHTTNYTYDGDWNRLSLTCPSGKKWQYGYNQRNQLTAIGNENWTVLASYQYDKAGNRQQRALWNGVITEYAPVDALNRSAWSRHMFNGAQLGRFDYAFDNLNRLKYEQREGATADGYSYDQASEVIGFNRDGTLSNGTVSGGLPMTLGYDFSGNRNQVTTNGTATVWSANNVNEYTVAGNNGVGSDVKGNVWTYNNWAYTYDAQNRLRVAQGPGKTLEFWYDGKNRQITRRINGDNNKITRSVWDGWNLLEERNANDAPLEYYLYGARTDELVLRWGGAQGDNWYSYDGRGNVSHLMGYNGLIIEHCTYDLAGKPTITPADANGDSLVDNRFMFQGRDYLKEGGIYDYRNRFYHPGLGRFLQPDPIGFKGDAGNLYRYCGNDPVDRGDPMGLFPVVQIDFNRGLQGPGRDSARRLDESLFNELVKKTLVALAKSQIAMAQVAKAPTRAAAKNSEDPFRLVMIPMEDKDRHGYFDTPRLQIADSKFNKITGDELAVREIMIPGTHETDGTRLITSQNSPRLANRQGVITDRIGPLSEPGPNDNGRDRAVFRSDLYHYGHFIGHISSQYEHVVTIVNGHVTNEINPVKP
jgi:RHS repeat-associated protein